MSNPNEAIIALKIQQGILRNEDELVTRIQDALDNKSYGDLDPAQFRNLVRVAGTTESPEVVKNFLRYQVGRDRKWGAGKGSLAETIIEDIGHEKSQNTIQAIAQEIAKDAVKGMDTSTDFKPIWMELIRRYLGYGARHLIYLNKGKVNEADQQSSSKSTPSKKQKPLSSFKR